MLVYTIYDFQIIQAIPEFVHSLDSHNHEEKSLKWFQIPIGDVRDLNNEKSQLLPCAIDFSD